MAKYVHEEFIRFDKKFKGNKLDFYGVNSPLDETGQKEFLRKYYEHFQRKYGKDAAYKKAVEEDEAKSIAAEYHLAKDQPKFKVYRRKVCGEYRGWTLYTDRTKIECNGLIFLDEWEFPLPCAKYEFDYEMKAIKFSFCIGKEYSREVPEKIGPVTTGRFIEFRKGCKEIIKLYFSPDGQFCYKYGGNKKYHYDIQKIGDFIFGAQNSVEIIFGKEQFVVSFGGEKTAFEYTCNEKPDTLFFSGGMQPADFWSVNVDYCEDSNGQVRDIFMRADKSFVKDEYLGEFCLPYAIGTEANKDYALVFRRDFTGRKAERTQLYYAADPGGEVYINGVLVSRSDGFDPQRIDISNEVNDGRNELEIVVFPRAPEVLYPWHRHDDYYNAWILNYADIKTGDIFVDGTLRVVTEKIEDKITFSVTMELGQMYSGYSYDVLLEECFPTKGEKTLIGGGKIDGNSIFERFTIALKEWSTEHPVLYKISLILKDNEQKIVWTDSCETGFRTIEQKNGAIYLNGEKIILKGALNMQFLPPYEEIPINHIYIQDWQIVQQALAIKRMNGNCIRQHQLGYGCSDKKFAAICDRLGVLLVWTTRLIDAVENLMWTKEWKQADGYRKQMLEVINSPSIIMWEGSNELHSDLGGIDRICDSFVTTVKSVDATRLICPVSQLYYGGGIYECGCKYYNTDGTKDESGNIVQSSHGWTDESVARSAHTYSLLLGYGASWRDMATQNWKWQDELFHEKNKAYIVSEFAIIGSQNPDTMEAKKFINKDSYEYGDESRALGYVFADDEWQLSQAFQSMCAKVAVGQLLRHGVDGMLWCCLWGGANNGSYLKPILDFYGYKKMAYYALSEMFQDIVAFNVKPDVLLCEGYVLRPMIRGALAGRKYTLKIQIDSADGETLFESSDIIYAKSDIVEASEICLPSLADGYYTIRYIIEDKGL